MHDERFEKAFSYMIENEGGYVFSKYDSGGETKYGISKKAYLSLNIKNLSIEDAKKIYYCDYWLKIKGNLITNDYIATKLFDLSVNLGTRGATIVLQRALRSVGINTQEDGLIGPETLSGVKNSDPSALLAAIKSESAGYYRLIAQSNPEKKRFLNGWLTRAYKQILFQ